MPSAHKPNETVETNENQPLTAKGFGGGGT
jgi:hypothetical protein